MIFSGLFANKCMDLGRFRQVCAKISLIFIMIKFYFRENFEHKLVIFIDIISLSSFI